MTAQNEQVVRALHFPLDPECTASGHRPEPHQCPDLETLCAECGKDYPCPTIDALDAPEPDADVVDVVARALYRHANAGALPTFWPDEHSDWLDMARAALSAIPSCGEAQARASIGGSDS